MKIKQQKQIEAFLTETFGKDKATELFSLQTEQLNSLIEEIKGKSKNQTKTVAPNFAVCFATSTT